MAALLFGLCLLFLCLSVRCREGDSPVLWLRPEEGTGRIGIYCNVHSLTGDAPGAILLEVNAPDGGRWQAVTAGEGAAGLVLTHGDLGKETVRILLDGIFEGDSDSPLLWLWLDGPLGEGEHITLTGEGGGELLLYVLRDGGYVERILLSVEREGNEDRTKTSEEVSEADPGGVPETTETTDATDATESPDGLETVPSPETEEPFVTDTPSPPATFLGCRETRAVEGMYTVQFLFDGEGIGTPILCMEGSGILYLSCEKTEGLSGDRGRVVRRTCTVQGLLADRKYVFWVGTDGGWVTVTYEGGVFCGFGLIEPRDTN